MKGYVFLLTFITAAIWFYFWHSPSLSGENNHELITNCGSCENSKYKLNLHCNEIINFIELFFIFIYGTFFMWHELWNEGNEINVLYDIATITKTAINFKIIYWGIVYIILYIFFTVIRLACFIGICYFSQSIITGREALDVLFFPENILSYWLERKTQNIQHTEENEDIDFSYAEPGNYISSIEDLANFCLKRVLKMYDLDPCRITLKDDSLGINNIRIYNLDTVRRVDKVSLHIFQDALTLTLTLSCPNLKIHTNLTSPKGNFNVSLSRIEAHIILRLNLSTFKIDLNTFEISTNPSDIIFTGGLRAFWYNLFKSRTAFISEVEELIEASIKSWLETI